MRATFVFLLVSAAVWPGLAHAQSWGLVAGRVTEQAGEPVPGATILVDGTNFGTATNAAGFYTLGIPEGRYALRVSAVGFQARVDSVSIVRDASTRHDVVLAVSLIEMENVLVEEKRTVEAGVHALDPEDVQHIPSPFRDVFRALKVMPGVAANNELSNEYSVRGGGFNENLIFVNGFEVYKPFRVRKGEQEGLGLLNPDLAERITFYTGGFPARYGGKLSSALDVQYARPDRQALRGSAYASLLDAGLSAGASALRGRLGWNLAARKARARHFFKTQELKGSYDPDYADVQGTLAYRFAPGHELEAVGLWAEHRFRLAPNVRKTYFGTFGNLQSIWTSYSGEETDGYGTRFAGVRLTNALSARLRAEHDFAYFGLEEEERFDITGAAVLYRVDPQEGDPDTGEGHLATGAAGQEDRADNQVRVRTWTAQGRYGWTTPGHAAEAGWYARRLRFEDRLSEFAAVLGRSTDGDPLYVVIDSLSDRAVLASVQAGGYVQDAFEVLPHRLLVTLGLRADHFTFNRETTLSPRASARLRLSERTTLTGAAGVYYQAPTYRELRGEPAPGETILGALNRGLRAQRSLQLIAGAEHFLPKSRLYLRAEAYYKHLDRLISYEVQNVRLSYSGENDARGHVYGLDMQVRGEFVPGLESWANYGFMVAREQFLPSFQTASNQGLLARPTDQRHTFSLFLQDYVPGDPTWQLHLRMLFGSGFPYTPPVPGQNVGGLTAQVPGPRFSARYTGYKRVDMGATKTLLVVDRRDARPVEAELTAEVLNVFDMVNTVAYSWIPNGEGIWQRIPTRLTPRTFNVRVRVAF